jgi:hypothetical protein
MDLSASAIELPAAGARIAYQFSGQFMAGTILKSHKKQKHWLFVRFEDEEKLWVEIRATNHGEAWQYAPDEDVDILCNMGRYAQKEQAMPGEEDDDNEGHDEEGNDDGDNDDDDDYDDDDDNDDDLVRACQPHWIKNRKKYLSDCLKRTKGGRGRGPTSKCQTTNSPAMTARSTPIRPSLHPSIHLPTHHPTRSPTTHPRPRHTHTHN